MGIKLSNLTETSGLTRPTGTSASGMKLALSSGKNSRPLFNQSSGFWSAGAVDEGLSKKSF